MSTPSTFGERVKQARRELTAAKRRDVTQQEVATRMGVSYVTVSRWENDQKEPNLETIVRLAAVLEVSPAWLAFGQEIDDAALIQQGVSHHAPTVTPTTTPPAAAAPAVKQAPVVRRKRGA